MIKTWTELETARPKPQLHYTNPPRKQSFSKTLLKPLESENVVLAWTENILKTEHFVNDDVTIIMWFPCPSFPEEPRFQGTISPWERGWTPKWPVIAVFSNLSSVKWPVPCILIVKWEQTPLLFCIKYHCNVKFHLCQCLYFFCLTIARCVRVSLAREA